MAGKSGRGTDPLTGFTFRLELEGKASGYFTEVSGLGSENEVIEQKISDSKSHDLVQKIPGRLKWGDITLKRGITEDMQIWKWRQNVIDGKMKDARTNCSIIMCDRNYDDVARWDFQNAWPSKVTGPTLKSDSNELGIEEMVLVHEGIMRKS
jgi:phage tail-like protein